MKLTVAKMRDLEKQVLSGEISFSRMVEIINHDAGLVYGNKSIIELEGERLKWSLENFTEATQFSSLKKLRGEIKEVEEKLDNALHGMFDGLAEEYADCLMCLFDSAGRAGIPSREIFKAFADKLEINKARKWVKNKDNTYSHVK